MSSRLSWLLSMWLAACATEPDARGAIADQDAVGVVDASHASDVATEDASAMDTTDAGPALLAHLGLSVGPVNRSNTAAGAVRFGIGHLPVGLFGGPDPEGAGVRPNLGFRVPHDTAIRSPLAAKLRHRIFQAGYGDWELHLVDADGEHPEWLIILDHVAGGVPAIGAHIALDQVLGMAAPIHAKWSLYELQVLREGDKPGALARHICPLTVMTKPARALAEQELAALFTARALPPYRFGQAPAMVAPGCVCWTISEARGEPELACDP